MTLPKWNSDWEQPDPLRGKRGWSRRHYAALGVAAALLFATFAVLAPAIVRARQKEATLDRAYKDLEAAMGLGVSGTLQPR
ncbi:hypothetical protein [Frigoriglobus tundricola]|nr:hypothetical protein [Frigoriglobus tundricola]